MQRHRTNGDAKVPSWLQRPREERGDQFRALRIVRRTALELGVVVPPSSDAVVLPYNVSSQSGVAAASFGSGRPVVATPVGGLMEQVIPGTGVIAKDMSAEAFADALTVLIGDPMLFDRCGAGALHHGQMDLDWQDFAQSLGDVIKQVCRMPRRGHEIRSVQSRCVT